MKFKKYHMVHSTLGYISKGIKSRDTKRYGLSVVQEVAKVRISKYQVRGGEWCQGIDFLSFQGSGDGQEPVNGQWIQAAVSEDR